MLFKKKEKKNKNANNFDGDKRDVRDTFLH